MFIRNKAEIKKWVLGRSTAEGHLETPMANTGKGFRNSYGKHCRTN